MTRTARFRRSFALGSVKKRRRAAKVTKVGGLRHRAQILGLDNAVMDTLEADQHDIGAVADGVHIVLTAGGRISAHL